MPLRRLSDVFQINSGVKTSHHSFKELSLQEEEESAGKEKQLWYAPYRFCILQSPSSSVIMLKGRNADK